MYERYDQKYKSVPFSILKDKILVKIEKDDIEGNDRLKFYTDDDVKYHMYHVQDCCEEVYIESIVGDLENLLNEPILMAEEVINETGDLGEDHETWTFYKLATTKGYVTIRWYGQSNGYYCESVELFRVN